MSHSKSRAALVAVVAEVISNVVVVAAVAVVDTSNAVPQQPTWLGMTTCLTKLIDI